MDTLHSVLRNIRGETKAPRNHLTVFREFLSHLERASRRPSRGCGIIVNKTANKTARRGK